MDPFASHQVGLDSPADRHFEITPNDDEDLEIKPRYLYVEESGDLTIMDSKGTEVTYVVTAGQHLRFRPTRVMTSTTATVVGWY